jgi:rhodanese-related sulfurtransferase
MERFKIIVFCLFLHISLISQVPDSAKYQSLEPYDFHLQYLKEDSALLIDVRQFFEYRGRRIKDAVNIPSAKHLLNALDTISKSRPLFLYCYDDYRSRQAAVILYDKGYRNLYNLEGGIVAWRKDGFPVDRSRVKRKE